MGSEHEGDGLEIRGHGKKAWTWLRKLRDGRR